MAVAPDVVGHDLPLSGSQDRVGVHERRAHGGGDPRVLAFDLSTQRREAVVQAIALEEREHVVETCLTAFPMLLDRRERAGMRRVDRRALLGGRSAGALMGGRPPGEGRV